MIFGEGAAFDGSARLVTCKVVADSALDRFDPAALGDVLSAHPELSLALVRIMSAKQRVLAMKVAGLSSTKPDVRICDLLAQVAQMESAQREEASTPQVHLTHQQIAAMTGLARVTVTRTLAKLARDGIIRTVPGYVEILDPAQVKARAAA
jgi:CRP/FNR family cyclic AMP-dependent transcriptional regulator